MVSCENCRLREENPQCRNVHEQKYARETLVLRPLQTAQIFHDLGLAPVHRANKFAANDATAVNDVSLGNFDGAILLRNGSEDTLVGLLPGLAYREEINAVLFQKFVVVVGVVIHADREHGNAFALKFLLHLDQRWHFLDARRAPRRPEIQDNYFSAQLTERDAVVGVLNGEIGSRRVDAGRFGASIAAAQNQSCSTGKHEAVITHTDIINN